MLDTAILPDAGCGRTTFSAEGEEKLDLLKAADQFAISDADLSLTEAVGRALCATGYLTIRDIQIEIDRGVVVLWGRVPTYYQKQLAQATAQKVDGVRGVANGIEVVCRRGTLPGRA